MPRVSVPLLLSIAVGCVWSGATGQGTGDPVLAGYVQNGTLWKSRGTWYNIEEWSAFTDPCILSRCKLQAVANQLWFAPEKGAVCGMCLKVFLPNGSAKPPGCPDPSNPDSNPGCYGQGTQPYLTSVSDPMNYGTSLGYDTVQQLYYFYAVVIEWFDRNQTDQYALSYPTQKTKGVEHFGTWPIIYEGVPCPTGNDRLLYNFLNAATPVPDVNATNQTDWLASGSSPGLPPGVGGSLCNNLAGQPCGGQTQFSQNPLGFVKLQITGQRIPISGLDIRFTDGKWRPMHRSGDNYWEPGNLDITLNATDPVDVRIYCADGQPPKIEPGLIPAQMLCAYQDPGCQPFMGTIQC